MESFVGKPIRTKSGANIFLNPGTGPVEGAKLKFARANVEQLIVDIGLSPELVKVSHRYSLDEDGRFAFRLSYQDKICDVDMPGLELSRVRYMSEEQDIWDFPRLYIDGSSWVWLFAINHAKSVLLDKE